MPILPVKSPLPPPSAATTVQTAPFWHLVALGFPHKSIPAWAAKFSSKTFICARTEMLQNATARSPFCKHFDMVVSPTCTVEGFAEQYRASRVVRRGGDSRRRVFWRERMSAANRDGSKDGMKDTESCNAPMAVRMRPRVCTDALDICGKKNDE